MLRLIASPIRHSVVTSGIFALACNGLLALQAPAQCGSTQAEFQSLGAGTDSDGFAEHDLRASQGQTQRIALASFAPSPEFTRGLADIVAGLGGQGTSQAPPATESASKDSGLPFKWKKKLVGKGNYSSIAVDTDGNPHVVYGRYIANNFVLTHAWSEGSHWFSEPIDAESHVGYDNAIAIDGNGGLHVAYAAEVYGEGWKLRYAHRTDGAWQSELVDSGGLSNSIAIDEEGFVHVVHVSGDFSSSAVHYAKQTASGWDLEVIPGASGLWFGGTSLRLHDGKVYATFSTDGLPRALELAIRDTGIWSVQEIDPDGTTGAMAFDQDGVLHVVYNSEGNIEIRHAWLDGLDWQSEALVTHTTLLGEPLPDGVLAIGENPALVEDSSGRLQLVFTLGLAKGGQYGGGLLGMFLSAGVWVPTVVISKLGGDTSIAVSPNDLVHVSTFKSKKGGDGGGSIMTLRLKGAKLSLSVAPKESGTISVSPSGLECTGKAAEFDFPGDEVMLTAAPATGFSFVKWSPASLGTDPQISITMDHKHKVTAHFVKTPD